MRILLAEDDPVTLANFSAALREHGHEVTAVPDSCEALSELRRGRFDLAILDWQMPSSDGETLLAAARREGLPIPPVLVVTATDLAAIGAEPEIRRLLRKPVESAEIGHTVDEMAASL